MLPSFLARRRFFLFRRRISNVGNPNVLTAQTAKNGDSNMDIRFLLSYDTRTIRREKESKLNRKGICLTEQKRLITILQSKLQNVEEIQEFQY